MRSVNRLEGKSIVVTGAGRGLGRAYAISLAAEGAAVLVNDVSRENAAEVVESIQAAGGQAELDLAPIGSVASADQVVAACVRTFGKIDVIVNNAGILRDRTLLKMEEADFDDVIRVHLRGTWACAQAAARRFREQGGGGSIINITSTTGLRGNVGQTSYAAAKAGIIGMTATWAMELERHRIRVNVIVPTAITDMVRSIPGMESVDENALPDELRDRYLGRADEVAPLVVFLASDAAAGVNGQILALGGNRLALWAHHKEVAHELRRGGFDVDAVEEVLGGSFAGLMESVGTSA